MSGPDRRLRVTLISHTYLEGYLGKVTELARRVDLRLIVPSRHPMGRVPDPALTAPNHPFEVVRYASFGMFWRASSTRWALASLDLGLRHAAPPPDIVHIENERHSFIVLQSLLAARLWTRDARIVVFVWENHRGGLPRERLTVPLGRWAARSVDYFLTGSAGAKQLLEQDGVAPERIAVAPAIGVDTDAFRPPSVAEREAAREALGICADDLVIGYLGRFVAEKGLHDGAEAIRLLSRDPEIGSRIRWLLVGEGALDPELDRWQQAGLPLIRAGPQRQEDTVHFYRAMDVVILPSRTTPAWAEQFGRVLIEAMACGVPIVGSDSGAIPEVIGDAGLVVPERDSAALALAIKTLALQPELRRTLGERGRVRAVRAYSNAAVAERIVRAYDVARALPPRRARE